MRPPWIHSIVQGSYVADQAFHGFEKGVVPTVQFIEPVEEGIAQSRPVGPRDPGVEVLEKSKHVKAGFPQSRVRLTRGEFAPVVA